ncbi:hypothetical protein RJT34_31921 [Clitoria ternatea]|uniref:BURP domain-containing protein n=1 Tax=Clitoria ternatea TaxID=43366 RepID=A0AAN9EV52_CLITE
MKVEMGAQKQVDNSYRASPTSSSDKSYLTGYRTTLKSPQPVYIASYQVPKHNHHHGKPFTNSPYSKAYETNQPNYLTGYKVNSPYSNTPYTTSYKNSNQPYITSYGSKQHGLIDSKEVSIESSQDATDNPYITQYGNTVLRKDLKESKVHDSTAEPYITRYGGTGPPEKDPKVPSPVDHTEAFKTGFFALDDLYVGNVMTLQFPIQEVSPFLPKKEAELIPFSMSQLPSVLQLFSIPEDSPQANAIRGTLEQCEATPITGETKTCVTSLESMLQFVDTIIGSETKYNILTTSYPTTSSAPLQKYTILEVSKDFNAPKWVACHPLPYPYAAYYCHFIATGSKVFKASLVGENGDNKIEALGICHLDTSDWSPDHILFKQLGFKPGQAPVCHFFPVNHLMWIPKQPSKATM